MKLGLAYIDYIENISRSAGFEGARGDLPPDTLQTQRTVCEIRDNGLADSEILG